MTITIDATPETEGLLQEEAARAGVPLPTFVLTVLQERLIVSRATADEPRYSLLDLEGLGAEMWRKELAGRNAQQYISEMRDEWDLRI